MLLGTIGLVGRAFLSALQWMVSSVPTEIKRKSRVHTVWFEHLSKRFIYLFIYVWVADKKQPISCKLSQASCNHKFDFYNKKVSSWSVLHSMQLHPHTHTHTHKKLESDRSSRVLILRALCLVPNAAAPSPQVKVARCMCRIDWKTYGQIA